MILIFTVLVSIILMNLLVGLAVSDIQVMTMINIYLSFTNMYYTVKISFSNLT